MGVLHGAAWSIAVPFFARKQTPLEETHVQQELASIFRDSIVPISACLAALYLFFAPMHLLILDEPARTVMATVALLSAAAGIVISLMARAGRIPISHAYVAGFAVFALVLINASLQMYLMRDIDQSSNFALVFVAVGLFFLSRWRLAVAYAITFLVWILIASTFVDPEDELGHFAIMNLQAIFVGALAIEIRLRSNRRLIAMRSEANERERKLAEALAKSQLYASVERENRAKTEFLANMSHELRTPLNAILGFSEAMQKELFGPLGSPRYLGYSHDIHNAGTHLLSLVNDILDLSRLELDGLVITPQKIDFARVCNNCLSIVRGRAERGGVSLILDATPPFPVIETDERRLKQVLINLLNNAVKFTPAGGSVTLELSGHSNGGAVIRVRDTGIGMSKEEVEQAMRPFWQADTGLDRAFEGAGLGLALVTELLGVMKGDFTLESEPGVGTVATVALPRTVNAGPESAVA